MTCADLAGECKRGEQKVLIRILGKRRIDERLKRRVTYIKETRLILRLKEAFDDSKGESERMLKL